jgi:hypothetical protein
MGGMPMTYQLSAVSQADAQNQMNRQTAMDNAAAAMNQALSSVSHRNLQNAYAYNGMVHPSPSVAATAASRVKKSDWEIRADEKEREIDEMIERQRQERERVRIQEEETGINPRGED